MLGVCGTIQCSLLAASLVLIPCLASASKILINSADIKSHPTPRFLQGQQIVFLQADLAKAGPECHHAV